MERRMGKGEWMCEEGCGGGEMEGMGGRRGKGEGRKGGCGESKGEGMKNEKGVFEWLLGGGARLVSSVNIRNSELIRF